VILQAFRFKRLGFDLPGAGAVAVPVIDGSRQTMTAHHHSDQRAAIGAVDGVEPAGGGTGRRAGVATRCYAGTATTRGMAVHNVRHHRLAEGRRMRGTRSTVIPGLSVKAQYEQTANNSKYRLHSSWLVQSGMQRKEKAFLQSMILAISFANCPQNASMKAMDSKEILKRRGLGQHPRQIELDGPVLFEAVAGGTGGG
jgi:hypothetical protein